MKLFTRPHRRTWLAVVGSATIIIGAAYAMVQQSTRLSANDTPLLLLQNSLTELSSGNASAEVVPTHKVELRSDDVSPFVIVADGDKKVLASSATLDGKTPLPPDGTFAFSKSHGHDDFTWQPARGVRTAIEMGWDGQHYVIAGQSLKTFEDRIGTYTAIAAAAWLAVLAWATAALVVFRE